MTQRGAEPGLSAAQRFDWLRLIRSENVGPQTFRRLINRFGTAAAALDAIPGLAQREGRILRVASVSDTEREIAELDRLGGRLVALSDPEYPNALRLIDAPPPILAVRGAAAALAKPGVAIVGSRNASAAGLVLTERLAAAIGRDGFAIVSGLARGIDARAHRAALSSGTIAVLAGGLDIIYPPEHAPLVDAILDADGAIVSEMPIGWEPRGRDFPRRNRIVAGMTLGTVVVEAARRSGSLITARFAIDQGRDVFAVPGSPMEPRAEGTNDLLVAGATLCRKASDVVDALRPLIGTDIQSALRLGEPAPVPEREPLWDEWDTLDDGGETTAAAPAIAAVPRVEVAAEPARMRVEATPDRVRQALGPAPVTLDELIRALDLPAADVQVALLDLELAGEISRQGGRIYGRA